MAGERDEALRSACFASLDVLRAQHGEDLPLAALLRGFAYRGERVPFFNHMKGIYRARAQRGRAALSVLTSHRSPYDDAQTDDGFVYAYRAGNAGQPDNRALRAAHELMAPIVYFVGTAPGSYRATYPCYVLVDDPSARMVTLVPGAMVGPLDERKPQPIMDEIARRYATREVKVRLHQGRFRALVLPAYRERCAICRLKEASLLDAAHIVGDALAEGAAVVSNGLSLCSIHHRAFDQHLVGVSPDYRVSVSPRLLDEEDGPMLDLLKQFHETDLVLPARSTQRPDRERLAVRWESFLAAS